MNIWNSANCCVILNGKMTFEQKHCRTLRSRPSVARSKPEQNAEKSMTIMDVNPQAVTQAMTDADVSLLIHGHTHRPAVHEDTQDLRRIVLGDWDTQGWYLECTEAGESSSASPLQIPEHKNRHIAGFYHD